MAADGVAELRELVALSALEATGMHDLFEDIRLLSEAGLPSFCAEVDSSPPVATGGLFFRHKLADRLGARLSALRARHINSGKVEGSSGGHGVPSEIEISPAMIAAGREAFSAYDDRFEGPAQIVEEIFRAMVLARDASPTSGPKMVRRSPNRSAKREIPKGVPSKSGLKA